MTKTLEALSAILAAEASLDQWDAAPSLGLLARSGDDFRLVPVQFSEEFWSLSDPATLLLVVARAVNHPDLPDGAAFPARLPEGYQLEGVAMFTEGWGLHLEGLAPEVKAQAMKLAEERSLATHPNRIEVKIIAALDIHGARYSTNLKRGATSPTEITEDRPGTQLSGRLYDGLDALLQALRASGL